MIGDKILRDLVCGKITFQFWDTINGKKQVFHILIGSVTRIRFSSKIQTRT
jgi:hypothetical protein